MISVFAFVVSMFSILFHISMGMFYFTQFALNGNAQEPATALDPCGFSTLAYFFSNSTPTMDAHMTDPLTMVWLRIIGIAMLSLGLIFYYETLFMLRFNSTNNFGLLHFFYMMLCVGGFRNHWADVDYLWPWFLFHLFLSLSLLRLKRNKIYQTAEATIDFDDSATTFSSCDTDDDDNSQISYSHETSSNDTETQE